MSETKHWQLNAFAKEVGSHFTTLNDWFNLLETRRVHYVNRRVGDGSRIFDELDLAVALFIKQKRLEKWPLDAITNVMREEIETRPFPDDFSSDKDVVSFDQLRTLFTHDMQNILADEVDKLIGARIDDMSQRIEELHQELLKITMENQRMMLESASKSGDRKADRAERMNEYITINRINKTLEIEALSEWEKLPESERYIKRGLFRREEDVIKREKFIREYTKEHFEAKLMSEQDK